MIIGIVPSIRKTYENQYELSLDKRLISFLRKNFPLYDIIILDEFKKLNSKYKLIVLSGGNTIVKFNNSKENILRSKLDNKFFNYAKIKKIPVLGICHGAQFIANKHKCKFTRKKHLGNHKIKFVNKNNIVTVNSFHNLVITSAGKNVKILARALDNTIEYFKIEKFVGIMWHPERNKIYKKFDKNIILSILKLN